ncbi:NlpC/P60 family protein [Amycolatopsis viridis]|uniref:Cell wall-associated NlpC family hydrolase n=1 Tax=Amycolatopsis viridis TaxID=185678 RepID=A0ABX0SVU8_9PSEU|nr:cell wall-associated NlpC family hydrolase [Amycolatopsis viridis]
MRQSSQPKSGRTLLRAGVTSAVLAAALAGAAGPAFASTAAPTDTAPAVAPASISGTSVGATALRDALTQLGKPYVWGAAGPNAYDCSGLVQWAFKQAGVNLPHSSRAQSTMGTPVALSQLRPGDLVFFYTPVSHVGIYVGDGKIVHASTAGQPVKISSMAGMPFHNARRI